ncbi:MAG: hypothetical protein CM15mP106_8200 [Candidatus Neomarinimicrobiota bacterium]|nr:MAG: hypothetical protein CM15mP106_8200 [Candidatus Neomarinimicrobiota bacterium]
MAMLGFGPRTIMTALKVAKEMINKIESMIKDEIC